MINKYLMGERVKASDCLYVQHLSRYACLQGGLQLMAVKADWQDEHHAYLAFSLPMQGSTSILDVQGTHFAPTLLPGVDPNAPSLLLEAVPGGWLLQVTPQVIAHACTHMCHQSLTYLNACYVVHCL